MDIDEIDYKINGLIISQLNQQLENKGDLDDESKGTNEAE